MPTNDDAAAQNLYISLMEEVKIRVQSINTITSSGVLPYPLAREYCFLQFRMLCELIALGCLIAHGDIKEVKGKSFQKAYKADEIIKRMEELHPDFYPVPVTPTITKNSIHLEHINKDWLTKAELIKLYGLCGDILHKGNLRRLLSPKIPIQNNFSEIIEWGQKILNLLSSHKISRVGNEFHFLALLEVTQLGGAVQVAIAKSPPVAESPE